MTVVTVVTVWWLIEKFVNKLIWSDVGYLFSELWPDLPFFKMNLLSRQKRGKMVFSKRIWGKKILMASNTAVHWKWWKYLPKRLKKLLSFLAKVKSTVLKSSFSITKLEMLMLLSNIECADKFAFSNSMKGILQIHQELLYNCKASAKTFQNLTNFSKMQIWDETSWW